MSDLARWLMPRLGYPETTAIDLATRAREDLRVSLGTVLEPVAEPLEDQSPRGEATDGVEVPGEGPDEEAEEEVVQEGEDAGVDETTSDGRGRALRADRRGHRRDD